MSTRVEETSDKENERPTNAGQQYHAGKEAFGHGRVVNKQSFPAGNEVVSPQDECIAAIVPESEGVVHDQFESGSNSIESDGRISLDLSQSPPIFATTPTLHCIEEGSMERSKSTPITPSSLIKPMSVANDGSPWMGMSGERNGDENVRDIRIWQNCALGAAVSISNNATGAIAMLEEIMKEATSHSSLTNDQTQLVEKQQREIMSLRKRNSVVEAQLTALEANKQANEASDQTRLIEKQQREIVVLRKLNTKTEQSLAKMKEAAEKAQKDLVCQLAIGEQISAMLEDSEAVAEERRLLIKSQQAAIEQLKAQLATTQTPSLQPSTENTEAVSEQNDPGPGVKELENVAEKAAKSAPTTQLRATFKEVTAGLRSLQGVLDEKLQNVEDELRAEFAQRRGMHFSRRVRHPAKATEQLKPVLTSTLLDRRPCFSTSLSDSEDSGSDSDIPEEAAAPESSPEVTDCSNA